MKTFIYGTRTYEKAELLKSCGTSHDLFFTEKKLSIETANLSAGCEAISISNNGEASPKVLERLKGLGIRHIAIRSETFDGICLQKADQLGIRVANVPKLSSHSVAEHAVALLMALNRKIVEGQMLAQDNNFSINSLIGYEVHGKTVGIIGTGKTGLEFARILRGFGVTLLAYDPQENEEALSIGIQYVSLEGLLRKSDIVSIHCGLNEDTKYLLSNPQFAWIKKGAILINTAHGSVVHTKDLMEALESGRVVAAGLDVYEFEDGLFHENHKDKIIHDPTFLKLKGLKNVLITCHQGFLTSEMINAYSRATIQNLDLWQKRKDPLDKLRAQSNDDYTSDFQMETAQHDQAKL